MRESHKFDRHSIIGMLGEELADRCEPDDRVRIYLTPKKILWVSDSPGVSVENPEVLLEGRESQISLDVDKPCLLKNHGAHAGILLDFGLEFHGGLRISSWHCGNGSESARVRIRLGESAMEAMSEPGEKDSANYHSVRDLETDICFMSMYETGSTGFRFARIDLLDDNGFLELKSVKACMTYKDVPYRGSFHCSDPLLDKIWLTGAYTVHLNMQRFLWDGIKRDRLVWIGDMHPETATVQAVFGNDKSVRSSLDFIRDETPLPGWMNGIPTYSMWWILVHYDWYLSQGDKGYLREQLDYLRGLARQLSGSIAENGEDKTPEQRFIDWATLDNQTATSAGIQALHILAAKAAREMFLVLGDSEYAELCSADIDRLLRFVPELPDCKQEAALMALAGLADADKVNREVLSVGGAKKYSAFMGYYILLARAAAGDIDGCLQSIREYWGGMLAMGATTFWEEFDVDWMENAAGIDEIASGGKIDIHGEYGIHCFKGYRKSLCHGWASGPTPWLSRVVLGVNILEPGCRTVRIEPRLGDLRWAEGSYPTPFGEIRVRHEKLENGELKTEISAPKEIRILRASDHVQGAMVL